MILRCVSLFGTDLSPSMIVSLLYVDVRLSGLVGELVRHD